MSTSRRFPTPALATLAVLAAAWVGGGLAVHVLLGPLDGWSTTILAATLAALLALGAANRLPWLSTSLSPRHKRAAAAAAVVTFLIPTIAVVVVPINVPAITTVRPYETITLSKGEKMALYHFSPPTGRKADATPVLFVNGGPGGPIATSTASFLEAIAEKGFEVYTFDHYSSGHSSLTTYDPDLLTIDDEVRRVHEIMTRIGTPTAVIGHSYAGALLSRATGRYPQDIASLVLIDTSPLYDLGTGNVRGAPTKDPELAKLLADDEGEPTDDGSSSRPRYIESLSWRENARGYLMETRAGDDGIPTFGSNDEWSYYLETQYRALLGGAESEESHTFIGLSRVAQLVNTDMERSPDFADALIAANTPPVLVVHPQNGVVPWPIHKDYENFFDSVQFLPVPDATHDVWDTPAANELLVRVIPQFLQGKADLSDFYTARTDPFTR